MFNDKEYIMFTDKEQLMFDALSEIADRLGDRTDNPVSLSLLCLTLGITNEQKGKLFVAYNQILNKYSFDELSLNLFKEATLSIIPEASSYHDSLFKGLIRGFAHTLIVELYPFSKTLD